MSEKLTLLNNLVAIRQPEKDSTDSRIVVPRDLGGQLRDQNNLRVHGDLHRGRVMHLGAGARRVKVGWEVYFHVGRGCFGLRHNGVDYYVIEEEAIMARVEAVEPAALEPCMGLCVPPCVYCAVPF